MNIEQIINWAADALDAGELCFGHGTDNAWDEAVWLVLHALGRSPLEQIMDAQERLNDGQVNAVKALIEKRISSKKPAAYLTNKTWFCGLEFYVDERTLVPRSPIGELIQQQFQPWVQDTPSRVLDMCTGGGCIAIACAVAFPEAQVVAADLSQDALDVARINVDKHGLAERLTLVKSDLFEAITGKFDLIVSNPPYVDLEDMTNLAEEFKHEPQIGLASGDDGLDATRVILAKAKDHLTENGWLFIEVGNSQDAMMEAFTQLPLTWIEFEQGGHGVFALSASDLQKL